MIELHFVKLVKVDVEWKFRERNMLYLYGAKTIQLKGSNYVLLIIK